jgi:LmbE family N-acetylglucosaminyl deacetylase
VPKISKKPYPLRPGPLIANLFSRQFRRKVTALVKRLSNSRQFTIGYAVVALLVLLGTTVVWSYLGARLQQSNADQLSDPLLFASTSTFHGAAFPAQHTFLLKWPIFYAIRLAHYSTASFVAATVGLSVATIGLFAGLLYRIDRRPLAFGTLCLALASCLLLVPAQPYAGGLLPVNMAMITTRNLEYIVYLFGLVFIARQPKLNSWRFWTAVSVLAVVCASDRLFLDISAGGAFLAIIVYALRQRWNLVSLSVNWLITALAAGAIAIAGLWVIDAAQVTHIIGQTSASPYASVHSLKNLVLAAVYAIAGILTNFGANPAYDAVTLRTIPTQLEHRLISISGISFVINAAVLVYGLVICARFLRASLLINKARTIKPSTSFRLTNMLIWTSLAAVAVFMITNHDYQVDSRYLTICLFAVFVAFSAYFSKKRLKADKLLMIAALFLIGMIAAVPHVVSSQRQQRQALASIDSRDVTVAQALATHHTTTLVGDYWRVLPTALASKTKLVTDALGSCATARTVLTSQTWQPDLHGRRFAYLLSFDKSLTDYPSCSLQQVTQAYGRPNSTELIAGTLANPTELLLFYDQGIQHSTATATSTATILPISIDELPNTSCPVPTDMNIVAHQDDDLLFMNPDNLRDIQAGHCVRTVYITAGDGGNGRDYWLSREQGAEAAYSEMTGNKQPWIQRVVRLQNNEYVTVANMRGDSQISLIFMRLPDGGLKGQGFSSTHNESLSELYSSKISYMHSVDGQSYYNASQLTAALNDLLIAYQPTLIRTQSDFVGTHYPDHSDHQTVGLFVQRAYVMYENQQYEGEVTVPIKYYIGYPIRQFPANVSGTDYNDKLAAFLCYTSFDSGACGTAEECSRTPTYNGYLQRQYQNPNYRKHVRFNSN